MGILDIETQLHRLEQQLAAFEKLHREELEALENKLAILKSLQADETKLLREELEKLRTGFQHPGGAPPEENGAEYPD